MAITVTCKPSNLVSELVSGLRYKELPKWAGLEFDTTYVAVEVKGSTRSFLDTIILAAIYDDDTRSLMEVTVSVFPSKKEEIKTYEQAIFTARLAKVHQEPIELLLCAVHVAGDYLKTIYQGIGE